MILNRRAEKLQRSPDKKAGNKMFYAILGVIFLYKIAPKKTSALKALIKKQDAERYITLLGEIDGFLSAQDFSTIQTGRGFLLIRDKIGALAIAQGTSLEVRCRSNGRAVGVTLKNGVIINSYIR